MSSIHKFWYFFSSLLHAVASFRRRTLSAPTATTSTWSRSGWSNVRLSDGFSGPSRATVQSPPDLSNLFSLKFPCCILAVAWEGWTSFWSIPVETLWTVSWWKAGSGSVREALLLLGRPVPSLSSPATDNSKVFHLERPENNLRVTNFSAYFLRFLVVWKFDF